MKFAKCVTCNLQHGVQLEITDRTGDVSANAIAEMLAFSMNRFKAERERSGDTLIDGGGFGGRSKVGNKIVGTASFSCTSRVLPAARWAELAIEAYVCANTVEQMQESLPDWKAAAEKDGSYLQEIVLLLEKPDVLAAVAAMIEHSVKKGPPSQAPPTH